MAAFRLKLTGLPAGPMGRIYTIPDNAMNRILAAGRASYGQVLVNDGQPSGPKRDMTDVETAYRMFDGFVAGWLDNAFVNTKSVAAVAASSGIVRDSATPADDNT